MAKAPAKPMTKTQLVAALADEMGSDKKSATAALDATQAVVTRTVAEGIQAWNPVFDVTPGELIDAIVTEQGVVERPTLEAMRKLFG